MFWAKRRGFGLQRRDGLVVFAAQPHHIGRGDGVGRRQELHRVALGEIELRQSRLGLFHGALRGADGGIGIGHAALDEALAIGGDDAVADLELVDGPLGGGDVIAKRRQPCFDRRRRSRGLPSALGLAHREIRGDHRVGDPCSLGGAFGAGVDFDHIGAVGVHDFDRARQIVDGALQREILAGLGALGLAGEFGVGGEIELLDDVAQHF